MSAKKHTALRILVTGGAGFVGSHLCDRLIARGDQVICVDNLFTGSKDNIAHLMGHPNFEFVHHDVNHPIFMSEWTRSTTWPVPPRRSTTSTTRS